MGGVGGEREREREREREGGESERKRIIWSNLIFFKDNYI